MSGMVNCSGMESNKDPIPTSIKEMRRRLNALSVVELVARII